MAVHDPYGLMSESSYDATKQYPLDKVHWAVEASTAVIDTLDEAVKENFITMYRVAFARGMLPYYFSGARSFDTQSELRDKYLEGKGDIAAPPGRSYHNYGRAVDVMIIALSGRGIRPGGLAALNEINKEFELGLAWGKSFGNPYHFSDTSISLDELQETSPEWQDWISRNPISVPEEKEGKDWEEGEKIPQPNWAQRNKGWLIPTATIGLLVGFLYIVGVFTPKGA